MSLLFSKGFPGAELLRILGLRKPAQINDEIRKLPLTGTRRIINPRAGLGADDLERYGMPPADDDRRTAGELLELAALALLRDVPLSELNTHPVARRAAETLGNFPGMLWAPGPAGLFRYGMPDTGRRLSTLLGLPVPIGWGATSFQSRHRIGSYGATEKAYNALQGGRVSETQMLTAQQAVTTGRGLASLAHQDPPYLIPLFVALQLLAAGAPLSPRFPSMPTEDPFVTGGGALAIQCALAAVIEPAMRDCWALKFRFMRERPERLWVEGVAGRLHPDFQRLGGWLIEAIGPRLPMIYAEGAPIHPDWPSGHATIAGAAGGILLATFADGPLPALGIDSVHAEIRQMMWGMTIGRSWAGIHTRSSLIDGLALGMGHARRHLKDLRKRNPEPMGDYRFIGFDGSIVTDAG